MNPLHFIKQLEIDEPTAPRIKSFRSANDLGLQKVLNLKDNQQSAFVNAGSLVTFEIDVSAQHQEDFLNSILLAQLAADKKFDRYNQVIDWYKFYCEVLTNIGWPTGNFEFTKYNEGGSQVEVDKVVIQILMALAGGVASAALLATIKALGDLPGDDRKFVLFSQRSQHLNSANFQISRVVETNGILQVNMGVAHFKSEQKQVRFLWFSFDSSKIELYKGGQNILLSEDTYSKVRKAIKEKLGENAIAFIGGLSI
jgi:hypothetical protein